MTKKNAEDIREKQIVPTKTSREDNFVAQVK